MKTNKIDMTNYYSIYTQLKEKRQHSGLYEVEDFIAEKSHKMGSTEEGFPVIFAECCDITASTPIRLKNISVDFSQQCSLKESSSNTLEKKFTIIVLNSLEADLQSYFFEVFSFVLNKFLQLPTVALLKQEIVKVAKLFMNPPAFSSTAIQGLWAELLVIANSSNPSTLVKAWHVTVDDKYDFNDGKDKIEVKSTQSSNRTHTFDLDQLNPNEDAELAIASIQTTRSGDGISLFELIDLINEKNISFEEKSKVQEMVYFTIGPHIEEAKKLKYDYTLALNSYEIFDYKDVPCILRKNVPTGVSSVKFSSCLKDARKFDTKQTESKLIKAL